MSTISTLAKLPSQGIRKTERQRMRTALHALSTGRGSIIDLVGDPGTGKTLLLGELADSASPYGIPVIHYHCTEFGQGLSGYAFREALGDAFARIEHPGGTPISQSPPTDLILSMLHELRDALRDRSRDGMIVLLDDFHWADQLSQEIVQHLLRFPLDTPFLLVVSARPLQTPPRLRNSLRQAAALGLAERMELGPLSLSECAEMTGLSISDERLKTLHRESSGNPLYLAYAHHELRRIEAGGDRRELSVPDEFATPLSHEFSSLEEPLNLVLQAAAVLSDRFDVDLLAEVARLGRSETCAAITELVSRDLLRPLPASPDHRFRHVLLQRLLYKTIPTCTRSFAHARARRTLEARGAPAAVCATHIERAATEFGTAERRTLLRAAEESLESAPQEAAHWLRVALRSVPHEDWPQSERPLLVSLLMRTLSAGRGLSGQRDLLRAVIGLAPERDAPLRIRALLFHALLETVLGRGENARMVVENELAELPPLEQLPGSAVPLLLQREITALYHNSTLNHDRIELALRIARENNDRVGEAGALALLSYAESVTPHVARALGHAEQSAARMDAVPDDELCAFPEYLGILSWAENLLGHFEAASRHARRGTALLHTHGRGFLLSGLLVSAAYADTNSGKAHQAHRAAQAALAATRDGENLQLGVLARALESGNALMSGESTAAEEEATDVTASTLSSGHPLSGALTALYLAHSARLRDDMARAESLILIAGNGPDLAGFPTVLRPACYETLTAAAVAEDSPIAQRWSWQAKAAADKLRLPVPRAYASLAQAHVLHGRPAEAAELYRRAACLFSSSGMLLLQAWAIRETAACLDVDHRSEEARSLLHLAAELALQSGGRLLFDLIRETPAPIADAHHRLRQESGATAALSKLTSREREVASIAGTGMKTRDIADALHLSPRTVEVHLTRIYRKLNISSRATLARMMAEAGVGRALSAGVR